MKREKKKSVPVPIQPLLWKQLLKWEDEPVLMLSLRTPTLPEDTAGLRRVGRYYRQTADCWKARWEGTLYRDACAAAAVARAASRPFRPWEAALEYTVTYNQEGLLSLYLDAREYTGGAHGVTMRCADTWEPTSGTPRTLRSFFPPKYRWCRAVLDAVRTQTAARISGGESLFFEDWPQRLDKEFSPDHFYLTDEGLIIFYPLYAVAPYAEGIPVFPIPVPIPMGPPSTEDDPNAEKL